MLRRLVTVHCSLVTSFLFLVSCSQRSQQPPLQTSLLIYRFDPPAFIEFSEDLQPVKEIPFFIPPDCGLYDTFPAPVGGFLVVELSCPNGQTVLFLDTSTLLSAGSQTASVTQPVTNADSHFLAWQSDGLAAYLKVDSLGSPEIIRSYTNGASDILAVDEFTYDLTAKPDSSDFTFTFSRGLGYGSEIFLARHDGRIVQLLYEDSNNYISFARWSPDGKQISFIKTPDSQTPFTVGELWVMDADGSNAHKLADADAGHGYAANWSPDGTRIAYVVRENPEDENADQSSAALLSDIYLVDVASGQITQLTSLEEGYAETPHWSPDGNTLTFNAVVDGRMTVFLADVESGEIKPLVTGPACCPAWMRK